jgi:hypothetical protein
MTTQNKAEKPNPALQPLSKLIGSWNTEGTHPLVTDKILHGHVTFEWIYEGAFLLMRSIITDDSRFPDGIAVFGSDNGTGEYFMTYFDERGISRKYTVEVKETGIQWWRDSEDFSQRFTLTISPDGKTMVSKGEMKRDSNTWEQDLGLTYTKVG